MRSALQLKFPSSDLPLIEQDTPYRCYFNIARKQLLHQLFLEHPYILSIQSDPTNSFQYPMTPETMADQIVKFIVQKLICNVYPPANITPNTYFMQSWRKSDIKYGFTQTNFLFCHCVLMRIATIWHIISNRMDVRIVHIIHSGSSEKILWNLALVLPRTQFT